ncbi:uncharacterized protein [Dysidea avara]|uniref:uncharacterized protein isoform X2 n=1 Tax=Dysidea avara TaxID=196820 RepID=UPI0033285EB4
MYRGKRIDLHHAHYTCKTNMAICHKNIGPLWKLVCLWSMGVDVPQSAVTTIMKDHRQWQKQQEKRHTENYLKYKNSLKQKASQRHEIEKDYMVTMNAFGITTAEYSGDTALEGDTLEQNDESSTMLIDENVSSPHLFESSAIHDTNVDCETTGGSHMMDHIIEIRAMVLPPDGVHITDPEFSTLCHTSRLITAQATRLCGIKAVDLVDQPDFTTVFSRFVTWMVSCVNQAKQNGIQYYPVLVAHNGFAFDYLFLAAEVKHRPSLTFFDSINIYFADTLHDVRRLIRCMDPLFDGWSKDDSLGLENLYKKFFPEETYNAHRPLDDCKAMNRIFNCSFLEPLLSRPLTYLTLPRQISNGC